MRRGFSLSVRLKVDDMNIKTAFHTMFRRVLPCVRFVERRRLCVPDQIICAVLSVCRGL